MLQCTHTQHNNKKKLDPPLNFNLQKDLKGLLYNCILVHMITLKEVT
jgi:hypothetical protein